VTKLLPDQDIVGVKTIVTTTRGERSAVRPERNNAATRPLSGRPGQLPVDIYGFVGKHRCGSSRL
jgi:hypothetical protein